MLAVLLPGLHWVYTSVQVREPLDCERRWSFSPNFVLECVFSYSNVPKAWCQEILVFSIGTFKIGKLDSFCSLFVTEQQCVCIFTSLMISIMEGD